MENNGTAREIGSSLVTEALRRIGPHTDSMHPQTTFKYGLFNAEASVMNFHDLIGCAKPQRMTGPIPRVDEDQGDTLLLTVADVLQNWSAYLLNRFKLKGDTRHLRAHLISEEAAELFRAMHHGDEVNTLDGLADLMYVVVGSAISMDLPLTTAFLEVHKSNMTKRVQSNDPDKARVRDKGSDYVPPRIAELLAEYRRCQAEETSA